MVRAMCAMCSGEIEGFGGFSPRPRALLPNQGRKITQENETDKRNKKKE